MRWLVALVTLLCALCAPVGGVCAQPVPNAALEHLPTLRAVQREILPDLPAPWTLAGQVEQETCITLKHSKCWNPRAELKTSIEYGFGLGQITKTAKFDNFEVIKAMDAQLKVWEWQDRYNSKMQIRALVVYDRYLWRIVVKLASTLDDAMAFMYCAYNGGIGGLMKDIAICGKEGDCNSGVWFDNVELRSFRAKKPVKGYGKSFFEINREYVRNVLLVRSEKYRELMQ